MSEVERAALHALSQRQGGKRVMRPALAGLAPSMAHADYHSVCQYNLSRGGAQDAA